MLDSGDATEQLEQVLAQLECNVQLPATWDDYFSQHGPLPQSYSDRRQYPRFFIRAEAALLCRGRRYCVFTRDVSRCGISFLHSEQLFPGEPLTIWLQGDVRLQLELTRCGFVQPRCYECGARILPDAARKSIPALERILAEVGDLPPATDLPIPQPTPSET